MKIGSKITFFYTSITIGINLLIILAFYVFTSRYINLLFDMNLCDKVYLTAQKHFEKDELDIRSYNMVTNKYLSLLPQANEIILNASDSASAKKVLDRYLTSKQQRQLYDNMVLFSKGKLRGVALYYPDNEGNFIVLVTAQNIYGQNLKKHILYLSLGLLLFSVLITFAVGRFYSERILSPLKHILVNLKKIRGNNMDLRLNETGNRDELDELIHSLNEMLDRLDRAFQSEKSFVSSASHEMSNPLTAIQGECEITLMKERATQEYTDALQRIYSESKRMSLLIKHLLFLSRNGDDLSNDELMPVNLNRMLGDLANVDSRIVFTDQTSAPVSIMANPHFLQIAIQNMLNNAVKYSQAQVDLLLKQVDGHPLIEIEDKGIGIPVKEIPLIFQSFYRASNTHEYVGHGIGLALSSKILHLYHARITVDSEENSYTRFTICFDEACPET